MPLQLKETRGQLLCFQTCVIAFPLSLLLLSFTTCAHNKKKQKKNCYAVGLKSLMQASHYSFTYDALSS